MDRQLRELERRAGGSDEDQARLLLARVRVGRLDERRLRLAAYVGDAAARLALRWSAPDLSPLRTWLVDLRPWGPEVAARHVCTEFILPPAQDSEDYCTAR